MLTKTIKNFAFIGLSLVSSLSFAASQSFSTMAYPNQTNIQHHTVTVPAGKTVTITSSSSCNSVPSSADFNDICWSMAYAYGNAVGTQSYTVQTSNYSETSGNVTKSFVSDGTPISVSVEAHTIDTWGAGLISNASITLSW